MMNPEMISKDRLFATRENKLACAVIFILAFVLYANTILHGYVGDDYVVLRGNTFTQNGISGVGDILKYETFVGHPPIEYYLTGGRYRPLSMVTFAVEVQFFGQNPYISHYINVLLYAVLCVIVYLVLWRLLSTRLPAGRWYLSVPFWAAVLYAAHPIHTEVVANIKSRDEIMCLLGSLVALWYTLNYLDGRGFWHLIYSFIAFFLALLSKENAAVFAAIIPLTAYYFTSGSVKKIVFTIIPCAISLLIYGVLRLFFVAGVESSIPDKLMEMTLYSAPLADRYATIFYTLGLYLKLLFFPHPLTYDYQPFNIPVLSWHDPRSITSFAVYAALLVYSIAMLRRKSFVSYGILFYLITLSIVSNLFFYVGTFMAERFVFIPSLGFCIVVAYLLFEKAVSFAKVGKVVSVVLVSAMIVVTALYSFRTITRNRDWKSNLTLTLADVKVSGKGVVSNTLAGGSAAVLSMSDAERREEYLELAIKYLTRAVNLYPGNAIARMSLGDAYLLAENNCGKAVENYVNALALDQGSYTLNFKLGTVYGKCLNDAEKSIYYLEKAIEINPESPEAFTNLAVAYDSKNDSSKALEMLKKAVELGGGEPLYLMNLGSMYVKLGDEKKAREYLDRAWNLQLCPK